MLFWLRLGLLLTAATLASRAGAHFCNDVWNSGYNIVVRPSSDTVSVPSSGSASLDVFVQNNTTYPLPSFAVTAEAAGYTIAAARRTVTRGGFLMPTENAKYSLSISRSGGGTLDVATVDFYVTFGNAGQSARYGSDGRKDVVVRRTDGSLGPTPELGVTHGDQGHDLSCMADMDFGDLSRGTDHLLMHYCVGRGSWTSGAANDTTKCPTPTDSTCADAGSFTYGGNKYDYQKLWAAIIVAARRTALDTGRTADLRRRLECGSGDGHLAFAGIAMMSLGYLGEDVAARGFLQSKVQGGGDRGTIAKAALVLMRNAHDMTEHRAALLAGLSDGNVFVAAACAAALGIVDRNDPAVTSGLVERAAWNEPDTSDEGKGFYPAALLSLTAWDRRGWKFGAKDDGAISFYAGSGGCSRAAKGGAVALCIAIGGAALLAARRRGGTRRVSSRPSA